MAFAVEWKLVVLHLIASLLVLSCVHETISDLTRSSADKPCHTFQVSHVHIRIHSIQPCFQTGNRLIVCCLLSNVCVVSSFYQSLQAMSPFLLFSICATHCTLSYLIYRSTPFLRFIYRKVITAHSSLALKVYRCIVLERFRNIEKAPSRNHFQDGAFLFWIRANTSRRSRR